MALRTPYRVRTPDTLIYGVDISPEKVHMQEPQPGAGNVIVQIHSPSPLTVFYITLALWHTELKIGFLLISCCFETRAEIDRRRRISRHRAVSLKRRELSYNLILVQEPRPAQVPRDNITFSSGTGRHPV